MWSQGAPAPSFQKIPWSLTASCCCWSRCSWTKRVCSGPQTRVIWFWSLLPPWGFPRWPFSVLLKDSACLKSFSCLAGQQLVGPRSPVECSSRVSFSLSYLAEGDSVCSPFCGIYMELLIIWIIISLKRHSISFKRKGPCLINQRVFP